MSQYVAKAEKDITVENTYSDWVNMPAGMWNFALWGTWVATVTVQTSFDEGTTIIDVDTFDENGVYLGECPETGVWWRFGVKTGDFTSGTVEGRLSR